MFREYPYLNLQDLNLDYILREIREMQKELNNFVVTNAIKYANPIDWNITTQYEKNTVVIDANSGIAYLSVQPVPSGVAITNTDYWTVIFDLSMFIDKNAKNLTDHVEGQTNTATFNSTVGDWLIWYDDLYIVTNAINAGDAYVVGSNIERLTVEDVIKAINTEIVTIENDILNINSNIGDLNNLTTTDKSSVVNAINEVDTDITTLNNTVDDLNDNLKSMPRAIKGDLIIDHFIYRPDGGARLQGACYVGNGVIVGYYLTDNSNTGTIRAYDLQNQTQIWYYPIEAYHGNSIMYNKTTNEIYICAASNELDNTQMNLIIVIDMNNPSVISRTFSLPDTTSCQTLVYDNETDKYYASIGLNQVNVYNNTLSELLDTITLDSVADLGSNNQGVVLAKDGILYTICFIHKYASIVANDAITGKTIFKAQLPEMFNKCRQIGEAESLIYDYDNDEYFLGTYDYNSTAYMFTLGMFAKINLYHDIIEQIPQFNSTDYSMGQVSVPTPRLYVANGANNIKPAWHLSDDTYKSLQDAINISIYYGVGTEIWLTSTRDGMTRQTRETVEVKFKNFNGKVRGTNASNVFRFYQPIITAGCNIMFLFCNFEGMQSYSTDDANVVLQGQTRAYFDRCEFVDFTPIAGHGAYHIECVDDVDLVLRQCTYGTLTHYYLGMMSQVRES